ncbi:MAG: hypothetical protein FWE98_08180 [Oscillospiraceae bacterium]|nr:hypothetical protein [Oscillospiraceae bacterium]
MKKKTKRRFLIIAAPLAVLLVLVLAYALIINGPVTELSSRLARYHNQGIIRFYVDGEPIAFDNVSVTLTTTNTTENAVMQNGSFFFRNGEYGSNTVRFTIPATLYNGSVDIPVAAEYVSENNWNVNVFMMGISINTESETVKVEGLVTNLDFHYFTTTTVPLDGSEIKLTASGI